MIIFVKVDDGFCVIGEIWC